MLEEAWQEVLKSTILVQDFSPAVREEFFRLGGTIQEWDKLLDEHERELKGPVVRREQGAQKMVLAGCVALLAIPWLGVPCLVAAGVAVVGGLVQTATPTD